MDTTAAVEATFLPRMDAEGGYDPDTEAAFEQFRDNLRQQNNDGGTLWVYRVPLDERGELIANSKNAVLFSAPIARFSYEEIIAKVQSDYMLPVERRICIRIACTFKGQRGMSFNQIVLIESPVRAVEKAAGEASRESTADIVRAIQEQQRATMTMMQELFARQAPPPAPATPPISQLRELAEVLFLMNGGGPRAAVAVAPPAPPPSVLEQLKTLREMREFAGELAGDLEPVSAGAQGGDDTLSVLKSLSPWAGLFHQLLQRQGAAPPARRLARPALRLVGGAAPSSATNPVQNPPGINAPAAGPLPGQSPGMAPVTPIQPATPASSPEELDPVLAQLREQFASLTQSAQEGADPAALASVLLQMIPENSPQEAALLGLLEDPAWFTKISAIYPPAKAQEAWFGQLRTALLAEFPEEGGAAGQLVPVE